ncbi:MULTISPECIES: LysR substrate-binding domain-containing protein [unclassified Vibrio]|uniref:LysR substrate-binding domain-containing protein n=1 Tax=unclassified Vibrio TaxID=2614977 RepID=UPI00136140EF|nr:LysR family transcriptional regulator [Vibrio sp. V36_P2S2PM302]NAX26955.1 LysR family transcriptional regulator [Vibrio sp. V38_P2S17PM301]NAX30899.1 LysR family transcriptional regulator [Vibrio sp. V37_P2S8PM304]
MKERMPPLQGLYYFYTAAELGSFKLAAEALFVTAAAVSQQIRQLEDWLGVELFIRQHRRVKLTAEGGILYQQTKRGFDHIQDGVRQVNQDPNPNQLSISTLPSFAQHWLVPRIGQFRQQHPELAMLIEPRNELINFQDSNVDICIRYGRGHYPNLESRLFMDEVLYPVCHPLYQQQHDIYQLDDLHRAELIEDTWPDINWDVWLKNIGQLPKPTIQYHGSQFVLEGALAVQGVALTKHSLAFRYIQEGKLVRIGDIALRPEYQYYLCAPAGYFRRPKIALFCEWIEEQAAQFQCEAQYNLTVIEAKY